MTRIGSEPVTYHQYSLKVNLYFQEKVKIKIKSFLTVTIEHNE